MLIYNARLEWAKSPSYKFVAGVNYFLPILEAIEFGNLIQYHFFSVPETEGLRRFRNVY